jgi:hypothetical protein
MADGRKVREGSVEDLSDRDAALLIQLGKAIEAVDVAVTWSEEPVAASVEPVAEPVKRKGRKRAAD